MYTILLNNSDNKLVVTSSTPVIMQRSSLVDNMHILVPRMYGELDMADFICNLEYITPIYKKYKTEILVIKNPSYKVTGSEIEYVEYTLPLTTEFTNEAGNIEMQLSFLSISATEDGGPKLNQHVRKTNPVRIPVMPIAAWSDIVPDEAFTKIDQRLIKMQGLLEAQDNMIGNAIASMPRDLDLNREENVLKLMTDNGTIGEGVDLDIVSEVVGDKIVGVDEDGIKDGVTDLDTLVNGYTSPVIDLDALVQGGNGDGNSNSGAIITDIDEELGGNE